MTIPKTTIESIEKGIREHQENWQLVTLGMGCFWGPDARFGSKRGTMQTCVGYAGGTSQTPTYRQMGDHTETVQLLFDPLQISYEDILREFWQNHYPNRDQYKGRQYMSLLFYHTEDQRLLIEVVKKEMEKSLGEPIETEIVPFHEFTPAEERHQKYYLKRYPNALDQLSEMYPFHEQLKNSTFAARLNGFVKGFGTKESVRKDIAQWNMTDEEKHILTNLFSALKW